MAKIQKRSASSKVEGAVEALSAHNKRCLPTLMEETSIIEEAAVRALGGRRLAIVTTLAYSLAKFSRLIYIGLPKLFVTILWGRVLWRNDLPKPKVLPGESIMTWLGRFVSKKTKEKVLDQTRRDDLDDYILKVAEGNKWVIRLWALRLKLRPIYVLCADLLTKAWNFAMGRKPQTGKVNGDSPSDDLSGDV
jgi:hypothetical protein